MSVGRVKKQGNLSSQRKGFYQEDSTSEREGGMVMDCSLLGIIIQQGVIVLLRLMRQRGSHVNRV